MFTTKSSIRYQFYLHYPVVTENKVNINAYSPFARKISSRYEGLQYSVFLYVTMLCHMQ